MKSVDLPLEPFVSISTRRRNKTRFCKWFEELKSITVDVMAINFVLPIDWLVIYYDFDFDIEDFLQDLVYTVYSAIHGKGCYYYAGLDARTMNDMANRAYG